MKLYSIRNWSLIYENNRSRELKKIDWFAMPNKQDGDGYTHILSLKDGESIFGAWVACAQVASRCDPRGTLLRDGGKPHDAGSLSRMTRFSQKTIERMFEVCSSDDINWLAINDLSDESHDPAGGCDNPASGCLEGKGKNGMEGNGREVYSPESRVALFWLNEKSGKSFRECESSLGPIHARLKESGVDIDGVKKMIDRQCLMWKNDPKMSEYLRPQTLFNKTKFDGYYAAKDLPASQNGSRPAESHQLQEVIEVKSFMPRTQSAAKTNPVQ